MAAAHNQGMDIDPVCRPTSLQPCCTDADCPEEGDTCDAGNSGLAGAYPAAYCLPNIISVAATDIDDMLASFSNFGSTSVDLGAPGVKVASTVLESDYGFKSGTSMAAPHVTGVVALVWTLYPQMTWQAVREKVLLTARGVTALQGKTVTGGVLNARIALDCNCNGVLDDQDINTGTSQDINGDVIPDECAEPLGACCVDEGPCLVITQACCSGVGGTFVGVATDCVGTETVCADGIDNDCDGLKDCLDPDCLPDPLCCQSDGECDDSDVCTCDECDEPTQACNFPSRTYGDVFPLECNGTGIVDIDDVVCVLNGFANFAVCPTGDIFPCPSNNGLIDIDDVVAVLNAFAGIDPCCSGGGASPGGPMAPGPILLPAAITLVANPTTIAPGASATVEGFISGASDLRGYQVALSVTGGTSGTLDVETLSIDIVRPNYVFSGLSNVTALDESGVRLGGALYSGGVNTGSNKYLGTFTFRASSDADGTFTVDFRTGETLLRDSNMGSITWDSGGSVDITVQAP